MGDWLDREREIESGHNALMAEEGRRLEKESGWGYLKVLSEVMA
jgi:hypothetical protein